MAWLSQGLAKAKLIQARPGLALAKGAGPCPGPGLGHGQSPGQGLEAMG